MKKMAEDRKDKAKRPLREQESGSNGLNGRRQSPVPKISTPASAVHRNSTPSQVPIRRETIRDRMLSTRVADASKAIQARSGGEIESKQSLVSPLDRTRRMTRNMQRPALDLDEVPQLSKGWTVQHPDWATKYQWNGSLLWQRERVDEEDISRLDEGGFLNDNLVMFYLRWLYAELQDRDAKTAGRIYLHNSHFYERLKPSRPGTRQINYDAVKSWTAKVDIFSFDYIVVPVCENIHWYLAIICNPSKLLPVAEADSLEVVESHPSSRVASPGQVTEPLRKLSLEAVQKAGEGNRHDDAREEPVDVDSQAARVSGSQSSSRVGNESAKRRRSGLPIRQYDPNMPRIVTLDSMDQAHSQTCVHLRDYLVAEIHARKHIEIENPGPLGMTAKGIPYQPNSWDCGIYLLGYMDAFFKNPDGFIAGILQREAVPMDIQPSALRAKIRSTIFDKMAEQRSSKKDQGPAKSHNVPLSVERASPLAEKLGRQQEPTTAKKVVDARNERPVREERTVRVIQQKPEAEGKENEQKQSTAVLPHGENSDLQPLKSPSKRPRSVQNRLSGSGHNAELEELCQESARMRKRLRSRETAADRRSSVTTQVVDLDEDEVANTTATSAAPADSARIVHIDDEKGDGKRSHNDDETTSRGAPWRGRPAGHPRTRPGPLVRQAELQHVDLSD